jgi:dienelactone hydrolase
MTLEYLVKKMFFSCSGEKCAGLVYQPIGISDTPGIVMGFGFGMIKEIHAEDYAPRFAESGYTVLVFDYRRFGESAGLPRQGLYPLDQIEDYRCAVNYLKTLPGVDPNRICIWGTSFSGGHVIMQLAFPQPGVKCGIAQVPNVYSYKTAISYAGSIEPYMELVEAFRDKYCNGSRDIIPIVSESGPSVIRSKEAFEYYTKKAMRFPGFKNYITIDSLEKILLYSPGLYAHLVAKPIFILKARGDTTTPPEYIDEAAAEIKAEKEVMEVDSGHFDIYEEPLLSKIIDREISFMKRYL